MTGLSQVKHGREADCILGRGDSSAGELAQSRRLWKVRWLEREVMGTKFEEVDRREVV